MFVLLKTSLLWESVQLGCNGIAGSVVLDLNRIIARFNRLVSYDCYDNSISTQRMQTLNVNSCKEVKVGQL